MEEVHNLPLSPLFKCHLHKIFLIILNIATSPSSSPTLSSQLFLYPHPRSEDIFSPFLDRVERRKEGVERKRDREIRREIGTSMWQTHMGWLPSMHPNWGWGLDVQPTYLPLSRNWTHDSLVHRSMLWTLSHAGQGSSSLFLKIFSIIIYNYYNTHLSSLSVILNCLNIRFSRAEIW